MSDILVEVTRGPLVETLHRGDVAVADAAGNLLYAAGDPAQKLAFWRSSAKPFQAMPTVYTGAAARWQFSAADLALLCASHTGEPVHTERVAAILQRIGLGPEHLRCGIHPPVDGPTAGALAAAGQAPSPLHSNCSGKHAGMLALALHLGVSPAGYLEPDHPVQRLILENISAVTGVAADRIPLGVDGCGVPCFGLSVFQMAVAFARLADPAAIPAAPGAGAALPPGMAPPDPEARRAAAAAICAAMMAHPYMVRGRQGADTLLMQAAPGDLVCKAGASGVWCVGVRPGAVARTPALAGARGAVALAVKMEDGGALGAREVALAGALAQLGVLPADRLAQLPFVGPDVRNVAGRAVGEVRPAFRLRRL